MRKLYNHTKGKIHPSPPLTSTVDHHLSLLPLAIATLAAVLSPEDQEVLAYLLSSSAAGNKPTKISGGGVDHPPQFNCNCFRCYTSFWVRWDSSPNQKTIHEIIDAYEDGLIRNKKTGKNKKDRKSKVFSAPKGAHATPVAEASVVHAPLQTEEMKDDYEEEIGSSEKGSSEKGPVRKIVSFIGERIWGVWGV